MLNTTQSPKTKESLYRKELEDSRGAILNVLEDYRIGAEDISNSRSAILNVLEDYRLGAEEISDSRSALLNVLEDYRQGAEDISDSRSALLNILEDLEVNKSALEQEKASLLAIGDGTFIVDASGKITFVNKTFENLLGWKLEEVVARNLMEVIFMEDEEGNKVPYDQRPIGKALRPDTTTTTTTVFYYVRKDKTRFPVAITVSPILIKNKIVGAVEIFRDITKEKAIDRAKSEFINLASHQLRTPLTGIQWTAELFLKKEKLTDEGKKYLQDITFSARRLNDLIRLLLNTSRIESGSVEVLIESLELVGFMNEYLRDYQMLYEKKNLTCLFNYPENLVALTDKNLLGYIIQNLVSNSIDYTPAGGKIEIQLEKKQNTFLFTVHNTGIAIPKKDQEYIFKKFFRASSAVAIKPDGTGLGLYIVSEAVKLLGGKVWFESEEGKGATFYVELPLKSQAKVGGKKLVGDI